MAGGGTAMWFCKIKAATPHHRDNVILQNRTYRKHSKLKTKFWWVWQKYAFLDLCEFFARGTLQTELFCWLAQLKDFVINFWLLNKLIYSVRRLDCSTYLNHVIRQLIYLAWQQTRNWAGCGPLQLISGTTTSAVSLIASSKLLFFESEFSVLEVIKVGPYKTMSQ